MPRGRGIAIAHDSSSSIQTASSSKTGAPWAAKITGIRMVPCLRPESS